MTLPLVSASLMGADAARLGEAVRAIDAAKIDQFHWDIMDGHFVPNLTFGPATVKALRAQTETFFDVHLMVTDPAQWIDLFADAGADAISFHIEAVDDPAPLIAQIKAHGIQAGIAFNPETEFHLDAFYLAALDRVLIMTVKPGFGGQSFIDVSDKIKHAAALRKAHPHLQIAVDGGINFDTAPGAIAAGATILISGSALFKQDDYAAAIKKFKGVAS